MENNDIKIPTKEEELEALELAVKTLKEHYKSALKLNEYIAVECGFNEEVVNLSSSTAEEVVNLLGTKTNHMGQIISILGMAYAGTIKSFEILLNSRLMEIKNMTFEEISKIVACDKFDSIYKTPEGRLN